MDRATPLAELRRRTPRLVDDLGELVAAESPSADPVATAACADTVADAGAALLGTAPEAIDVHGRRHLRWRFGRPRVLLLGHFDTVWPLGTLDRWPFAVRDGRATGPGTFDMKAGIVSAFHAVSLLDDPDGVAILLTSDEELGSPTSRHLIEQTATGLDAVLVLEPSAAGALKVARKGVSDYRLRIEGRAAHAGLEPEKGANALIELAYQVLEVSRLARPSVGTTVTPTVATAGTASNVVPATASVAIDVRVETSTEQARVDEQLRALRSVIPGTRITVEGGPNRPPLQEERSRPLFERASALAEELGLPPLDAARVGGGSDGNFTAALGIPTLDGLGAVGDGAHAEGEHVIVDALPERTALVSALVQDLLSAT